MNNIVKSLYSYFPASPEYVETIETAIAQINSDASSEIRIKSHKSITTYGSSTLPSSILPIIEDNDLLIFDLTYLDLGVLFELGYAISSNKKIVLTLNSSFPFASRNYQKLSPLSTISYIDYANSYDLVGRFFSDEPHRTLETTIYNEVIQSIIQSPGKPPAIFYLQCPLRTDASIRLTASLQRLDIQLVLDDPSEVTSHSLSWYAENTYYSYGVIAHLIDSDRAADTYFIQNAKNVLISGMGCGFGKPVIILSHQPSETNHVFQNILVTHKTAQECVAAVENWIPTVDTAYKEQKGKFLRQQKRLENIVGLLKINLGEYIAENERGDLLSYFIDTAPYRDALSASQYKLFVGRKGSGKTANLYALKENLRLDKRNHVCVITPVDYEFEGVLKLLVSNLSKAETGYLTQSLWKYLIYTELSQSILENIKERPAYISPSKEEESLIKFIGEHSDLGKNFTERMEYAIEELCKIDQNDNIRSRRSKVSEILHDPLLAQLHEHLSNVLHDKNKVYILVDNLDKAWEKRENLDVLADFIFGLLSASQTISEQFQKGGVNRPKVNLTLIVFLRSDIFSYIMTSAREGDKISSVRMDWNDPILLQRVIEERFCNSLGEELEPEEVWTRYFPATLKGIASKEYITSHIIPRPRDIIFLCKTALSNAINHKNIRIEEIDIENAEKQYSEYVFNSVLAETETKFEKVEELLYEFVGHNEIVEKEDIIHMLGQINVPVEKVDEVIDLLFENTFLGVETSSNTFEFLYESNRKKILLKLAENYRKQYKRERYRINNSFHAFLGILPHDGVNSVSIGNEHPNIETLINRMDNALAHNDYPGVLHASSNIFETMAKDIVDKDSIQDQTLGSFFDKYRKDSKLPEEILNYILSIYNLRNTTPLAGHGSTREPTISREAAITLVEMTRAFVRIEYKLKTD